MPIDPTAIIDPAAKISPSASIGPYCVIGPYAIVGDDCDVGPWVLLGRVKLGARSKVGAHSVIGTDPQVYRWEPVESYVEIAEDCLINEHVVIHRSMYDSGRTIIGPGCYVMSQSHIAHDCVLGREVTLTTLAGLSGHVEVGDFAVIGGGAGIHQHVRIGSMSMVGGMARIIQDVAPFFTVAGAPATAQGLNSYALRKRRIGPDDRKKLKAAYRLLVRSGLSLAGAIERIEGEIDSEGVIGALLTFLKGSKRGVTL